MSESNKKSVWPLITAVLIGLPVLYVASIGPACWIASRTNTGAKLIPAVYRPILLLCEKYSWANTSVQFCTKAGAADGWYWCVSYSDDFPRNPRFDWSWKIRMKPLTSSEIRRLKEHMMD